METLNLDIKIIMDLGSTAFQEPWKNEKRGHTHDESIEDSCGKESSHLKKTLNKNMRNTKKVLICEEESAETISCRITTPRYRNNRTICMTLNKYT